MTIGTAPYIVVWGTDESGIYDDIDSAIAAASDIDEEGAQDPIQIVDSRGEIVLHNGELTSAIIAYRERRARRRSY